MSSQTSVAILRRKSKGISHIKGMKGRPREYGTNTKSRVEDGQYIGEWGEPNLPGGKHFLALWWNDLKSQWCWGASTQELDSLVDKLQLKYEKGHNQEGKIITKADLRDINDPFFTHTKFQGQKFMEGGRIMLNLNSPEDKVYYNCYKGNHQVHDKSENLNSTFVSGALYELINPKKQDSAKARDYKFEADATKLLSAMEYDFQCMIAEIMEIPISNPDNPDPDALFVVLTDFAVRGDEKKTSYGNKTGQEFFIELATLEREKLVTMSLVSKAKKHGIIRRRNTYWQFNSGSSNLSDRIQCDIKSASLLTWMTQEENSDYFQEMLSQLEAKGIKTF